MVLSLKLHQFYNYKYWLCITLFPIHDFIRNGSHTILKFGFIHITTESLVRGLHVSLRTIAISFFGILIALTSQVVMIFYSLMQHLKVKSKVAYAFMAAIRMIPLMISSLIQLRRS